MRDSSLPFLLEFVGVPGSGKSTISRRVAETVRNSGNCSFNEPTHFINGQLPLPIRPVAKLPYAGYGAVHEIPRMRRYITRNGSTSLNPSLLFNWLFVRGVVEWNSGRNWATALDQGLIQAFWSFRLSESDETVAFFRRRLLEVYPETPSLIVCVEASPETVETRLASRVDNRSRVGVRPASFDTEESWKAYRYTRGIVRKLVASRLEVAMLTLQNDDQAELAANVESVVDNMEARIQSC